MKLAYLLYIISGSFKKLNETKLIQRIEGKSQNKSKDQSHVKSKVKTKLNQKIETELSQRIK